MERTKIKGDSDLDNAAPQTRRFRGILNASQLKLFAIVSMLIDHTGAVLVGGYLYPWAEQEALVRNVYMLMRGIGRLAFPIFIFFLVQGFVHTRSRKKYAVRLLIFSLVSEIPFDLAFFGTPFYLSYQNVGWELLLAFLMLMVVERIERGGLYAPETEPSQRRGGVFRKRLLAELLMLLTLLGFMLLGLVCCVDYRYGGILLCYLFYRFRKYPAGWAAAGCVGFGLYEPSGIPGVLLNLLYNGEKGKQNKYFFYIFYPAHLLVLYLLVCWLTRLSGF